MKKIIFLQNHPVFTLDISKIINPHQYDLYLISIPLCIEQLKSRNQECLFKEIHALEKFELSSLTKIIDSIIIDDINHFDIVTSSEQAMDICGKLRVHYALDEDNLERYANKITMKQALQHSSVRYPKYAPFNPIEYQKNPDHYVDMLCQHIPFPMFAKPINEAGSIGTALIPDRNALKNWCKTNDTTKSFEIDEYVEGILYHCDTFIKNKTIIHTQVSMCLNPCFDFTRGKPVGSITLPSNSLDSIRIKEFNENTLAAMGLPNNAITHLEILKKNNGELVFVEIAARPPASMVPKTYHKHLGVSIMEAHVLMQIDPHYVPHISYGPYSAFVIYPKQKGIVTQFNDVTLTCPHEVTYNIKIGDKLEAATKVRDLAGGILFWNDNPDELMQDYLNLNHFKLFEVATK